jgi:hypothetical protein
MHRDDPLPLEGVELAPLCVLAELQYVGVANGSHPVHRAPPCEELLDCWFLWQGRFAWC